MFALADKLAGRTGYGGWVLTPIALGAGFGLTVSRVSVIL
jgi:hypothetical protein